MLYDKRWDKEIKADPFSLESLITWLEKQDPHAGYNYCDTRQCLLAQYHAAHGTTLRVTALGGELPENSSDEYKAEWIARGHHCTPHDRTFGAALERARALQAR